MIVTLIEKVYSFLWGDLVADSTAGRQFTWDFIADHFADPYGDLFYHSDTFPA